MHMTCEEDVLAELQYGEIVNDFYVLSEDFKKKKNVCSNFKNMLFKYKFHQPLIILF